ncbi:hypothetical protein MPSEU_000284800 [Mayamaea pseudoterrestris]|nr:hypothetical protein MPSEU_000284800 [Mayamaea pseudoterrestris]
MPHQYAFDAAKRLTQCLEVLDDAHKASPHLMSLKDALLEVETQLQSYFQRYIDKERHEEDSAIHALFDVYPPNTLESSMRLLKRIRKHKRKMQTQQCSATQSAVPSIFYEYPQRTTADTLLFRLINVLRLCLVRLENETPRRNNNSQSSMSLIGPSSRSVAVSFLGVLTCWRFAQTRTTLLRPPLGTTTSTYTSLDWIILATKVGVTGIILVAVRKAGESVWRASKIANSTGAVEDWSRQWRAIQPPKVIAPGTKQTRDLNDKEQARLLVEFALKEPRKLTIWRTSGELRFFMLKRAMDIFYASVETAMEVTNARSASDWQLLGATAAAASFYSTPGTGAGKRVAAITSSSRAAGDLIRNAWGMVSLPAVKNLSLQASRFLKGASVADRIEICGVSCFVLSKDPAPELATSIDRHKRLTGMASAPSLDTIDEDEEHTPTATCSSKPFARTTSLSRHRQRDVIFHLTGGGFFAHIIATDLPYLLDWSAATGAVVICPEYALLPDHCFPDALHQITNVYSTLVNGDATPQLGFEVNRIVLTGESAGGNLASALCIQLSRQVTEGSPEQADSHTATIASNSDIEGLEWVRMPDALMLSCPVLNLSSDLSPSRMASTTDPVMPGSVISAISDAYIPQRLNVNRKDPLVSPIFASDENLKHFPPTLLFASSNDPVLDDSVIFNRRLRSLGVDADLQVADNLPHAYLGLGIAAFPEAVQVQQHCQSWLTYQLTRRHLLEEDSSNSW